MQIQFDWGKRILTFYAHPSTDNKGGRATKNTMGRWLSLERHLNNLKTWRKKIKKIIVSTVAKKLRFPYIVLDDKTLLI